MIVSVEPVIITLPPPRTVRSEGVHVSAIIRCIALETGILAYGIAEELDLLELKGTNEARFADPVVALRICIGLAWEEWYIPQLPEVVDHPGEMCVAGIYMTHDGEALSAVVMDNRKQHRIVVHEVKATYKSIRTVGLDWESLVEIQKVYPNIHPRDLPIGPMRDQWMWLSQVKAYCKGAGTRFAVIHVLFLDGDYSYPLSPALLKYNLEFTQEEIDDNWELLEEYRDRRIEIERGQQ